MILKGETIGSHGIPREAEIAAHDFRLAYNSFKMRNGRVPWLAIVPNKTYKGLSLILNISNYKNDECLTFKETMIVNGGGSGSIGME